MLRRIWCVAPFMVWAGCSPTAPPPQTALQSHSSPAISSGVAIPAETQPPTKSAEAPAPVKPAAARSTLAMTIPAGTVFQVRLADSIDTARNQSGDRFGATLDRPVVINSRVVIPKGTRMTGRITYANSSGRLNGRALLGMELESFRLNGHNYRLDTTGVSRSSTAHKKRNAGLIGGGSGFGAAIGAIAGGGKGALIGAVAGAAAGTAGAAATGKKNVVLPVESLLRFKLEAPVRL